jgi:hypothetical protein
MKMSTKEDENLRTQVEPEDPVPVWLCRTAVSGPKMEANPAPQLPPALAPNSLPNAPAQPVPDATSIGHRPSADATIPPAAVSGTPGPAHNHRIGLGTVFCILVTCGFLAFAIGLLAWLRDKDLPGAIFKGGVMLGVTTSLAFAVAQAVRERRR